MKPETTQLLNRLLAILCRSFPQYLKWSRPYVPTQRRDVMEMFDAVVDDQNHIADRISQMLIDADCLPRTGEYPMEFTNTHDLGIDFVIRIAADYQQQDVAAISDIVDQLRTAPAAKAVAEEALGMSRGHLDSLRELQESAAASA